MPVMTTRLSFIVPAENLPASTGPRKQSSRQPSLPFICRPAAGALDHVRMRGFESMQAKAANDPSRDRTGFGPDSGSTRNDSRHEDEDHRNAHRQDSELSEGQAHEGLR